jgi:hypothetical protein
MFSSLSILSPDLCCVNARCLCRCWLVVVVLSCCRVVGGRSHSSFLPSDDSRCLAPPSGSIPERVSASLGECCRGGGGIGLRESFRTRQLLLLLLLLVVVILMSWQSETCSVLQAVLLRKTSTQAVQNAAVSSDHWKCFTVTGPLHVRMAAATWPAPRPGAWPRRRTPGAPPPGPAASRGSSSPGAATPGSKFAQAHS